MASLQLVPIRSEDEEQFTAMAISNFRDLNPEFVPHDDWKQHYFSWIQANPNLHLEWIQQDGKNAGFILYGVENHRFFPRKSGVIYELYVEPGFRKHGLAREAATQAIRVLRQQPLTKIYLDVMDGNTVAVDLWKSLGFQKVTERYVLAGDGR